MTKMHDGLWPDQNAETRKKLEQKDAVIARLRKLLAEVDEIARSRPMSANTRSRLAKIVKDADE